MMGLIREDFKKSLIIAPSYPSTSTNNKSKLSILCLIIKSLIDIELTFSLIMSFFLTPCLSKWFMSN